MRLKIHHLSIPTGNGDAPPAFIATRFLAGPRSDRPSEQGLFLSATCSPWSWPGAAR
jgi:hypothetical protein